MEEIFPNPTSLPTASLASRNCLDPSLHVASRSTPLHSSPQLPSQIFVCQFCLRSSIEASVMSGSMTLWSSGHFDGVACWLLVWWLVKLMELRTRKSKMVWCYDFRGNKKPPHFIIHTPHFLVHISQYVTAFDHQKLNHRQLQLTELVMGLLWHFLKVVGRKIMFLKGRTKNELFHIYGGQKYV